MAMMVNILGQCVVRDEPDNAENWPGVFACRPAVGDIMRAESGRELTVVGIKHAAMKEEREGEVWNIPQLIILLA